MSEPSRARRVFRRIALVAILIAAGGAAWFVAYGGRFLQHEDPRAQSDAVVALAGTRVDRWLEAVDLFRAGYARAIVISPGRVERGETRLRELGVHLTRDPELARDVMVQLGVPRSAVYLPEGSVDNTAQEASLVRDLARTEHWSRLIIVTSKYHTRRTGFAFRRALRGSGIAVVIRATKYDDSDPAHWWRSRADVRWVLSEWQKLIAYWCGLSE